MTSKPANLLGALCLSLNDRITAALEDELGIGGIAPAALVVIGSEVEMTVEQLAKVLKLGQSSMVRAVQQLETKGLIEKSAGKDRRTLRLTLTKSGQRKLTVLLQKRAAVLEAAIAHVPVKQRKTLEQILSAMLFHCPEKPQDKFSICRLCDENSCGAYSECPVERGACRLADQDARA